MLFSFMNVHLRLRIYCEHIYLSLTRHLTVSYDILICKKDKNWFDCALIRSVYKLQWLGVMHVYFCLIPQSSVGPWRKPDRHHNS